MYLHFSDRARYENLHLSTGLEDWDMVEEMQQCVTIDQYFVGVEEKVDRNSIKSQHGTEVSPRRSEDRSPEKSSFHPTLWLIVDPNVVMPCPERSSPRPDPPASYKARSRVHCSAIEDADDEALTSSSELCTEANVFMSSSPSARIQRLKYRKGQVPKPPYEAWPRPPINYCNLISLALKNSGDGSLNVQQIYSFVREHFPFFRVAPDAWKNTVRHNLCFSSSFEKSAGWVCADGHRRSCLWKLTRQGRMKFRSDMRALSEELLLVLRRSMNKPALMELMFGM
ncbi:forkhead box protein R1 [Ranitomeya imitator]|uniref:forkhead box protein R1 n=1 Tax=Ranitomeya imitator TaxID=111125 RepID=UPI0037E9823A